MLKLTNLTLARGVKQLVVGANLTLFPGHKVGLIGPNGAGEIEPIFAAAPQDSSRRGRV